MRIIVGGSAANPPHVGHKVLIERLLICGLFDKVIWIPSGIRKGKEELIDPNHRVAMTMLTFPSEFLYLHRTTFLINFQDVYGKNTSTIDWLRRFSKENPSDQIFWYTGADSVVPQERLGGRCEIEAEWAEGDSLMRDWNFYILPRQNDLHLSQFSLPPKFKFLEMEKLPDVSSTDIRERIASGKPFETLVTQAVADYIKRFSLYGWEGR